MKRRLKKFKIGRIIRRRRAVIFKKPKMRQVLKPKVVVPDKERPGSKRRLKGLSELIALGKEKGHLTFEEVNNILPVDIVSSEEIDEILGILGEENIKLVDSEEDLVKEQPEEASVEEKKEPAASVKEESSKLVQIDDPVKMYLRQMGQISLLTRKEEIEIAEKIKDAEAKFRDTVSTLKLLKHKALEVADKIIDKELNPEEFLNIDPRIKGGKLKKKFARLAASLRNARNASAIAKPINEMNLAMSVIDETVKRTEELLDEAIRTDAAAARARKRKNRAELSNALKEKARIEKELGDPVAEINERFMPLHMM